jgi:hypothetical protein
VGRDETGPGRQRLGAGARQHGKAPSAWDPVVSGSERENEPLVGRPAEEKEWAELESTLVFRIYSY